MTAPQDPFSTPSEGSQPAGFGAPGSPGGYGAPGEGGSPGGYGTPGGYGSPAGYGGHGQPQGSPKNGFGTAALVLGILGLLTSLFFGGIVFGIPAIVLGALGRGRANRREATNGGMAVAGLVLGVVSLLITAAIIAFGVSLLNSDTGRDYQDCLRDAAGDQAASEQCARQFSEQIGG